MRGAATRSILIAGFAVVACAGPSSVQWTEGPGYIIEPSGACGVEGVWRMAPSPLSEGRTVVEFISLSSRSQNVSGTRMEVDCDTLGVRVIGQARYGQIGSQEPLGIRGDDQFDILNERNAAFLDPGPFRESVATACRLHRGRDQAPDFANLDEFVEATGRVDEDYFAGKSCIVASGAPTIVEPE